MTRIARVLAGSLLIGALAIAGWWAWNEWSWTLPNYESVVTTAALLATVVGTLVDRWAGRRERRRALLHQLAHEIHMNFGVLDDEKFKPAPTPPTDPVVYPRLYMGTLQAVIASGAFTEKRDRRLFRLLHDWLQRAQDMTDRIVVTEIRTFTHPIPAEIALWRTAITTGGALHTTRMSLIELSKHLVNRYSRESGLGRDMVTFHDSKGKA